MRDAKARTALVLMQCLCQLDPLAGYTKAIISRVEQRIEITLKFISVPDLPPGVHSAQ